MLKIIKENGEEKMIQKGNNTRQREKKKLLEDKKETKTLYNCGNVDFLEIVRCLLTETSYIYNTDLSETEQAEIERQKEILIAAIVNIAQTINLLDDDAIVITKLQECLTTQVVDRVPYDVIPNLRFIDLIPRINAIIDGYEQVDLSYEKTNEIATDLTRIESSLTNIEKTIESELRNTLVYKEV